MTKEVVIVAMNASKENYNPSDTLLNKINNINKTHIQPTKREKKLVPLSL